MSGLLDELRSDQKSSGIGCSACVWLSTLSASERAEWAEAFIDKSFTTMSLIRAAVRRDKQGLLGKGTPIETHRKQGHKT